MDDKTQISLQTTRFCLLLAVQGSSMKEFLRLPIKTQLVWFAEFQISIDEGAQAAHEINAVQRYLITKYGALPGASGAN